MRLGPFGRFFFVVSICTSCAVTAWAQEEVSVVGLVVVAEDEEGVLEAIELDVESQGGAVTYTITLDENGRKLARHFGRLVHATGRLDGMTLAVHRYAELTRIEGAVRVDLDDKGTMTAVYLDADGEQPRPFRVDFEGRGRDLGERYRGRRVHVAGLPSVRAGVDWLTIYWIDATGD